MRLPIPIAPLIILPSLLSGTEHHNSCKVGTLGQDLPWQGRAAALLSGEDLSNLIPRLYIPTGNEVSASLECIIYIGDIFASDNFFCYIHAS